MTLTCKHDNLGTCVIYPSDRTAAYCAANCESRKGDNATKERLPYKAESFTRKALRPKGKTTRAYIDQERKAARLYNFNA